MPEVGKTVAAPRNIPFGSVLHIQGVGYRRVDDRLAKKYDDRVDVFFATHAEAVRFGKQQLQVQVVSSFNIPYAVRRQLDICTECKRLAIKGTSKCASCAVLRREYLRQYNNWNRRYTNAPSYSLEAQRLHR